MRVRIAAMLAAMAMPVSRAANRVRMILVSVSAMREFTLSRSAFVA